ncbi:sugar ABC transporter ATP-binding protein [Isoptericola dokdonensis]|jgi:monosaccharide-transporting ATPase|uniref:Ribose import ATP-binding protein RbsA n=1 Tax=Isoptericola dokdonensis DS-3 TaxID=1300344 RepID=A0A168F8B0_9MICO|nr:sugar ABC transporter ATP-binding protein [Isoptericola dokdonensis]ANC31021.1 Ribose import ATP-binding protein RbsA [Isoptericola dokdonensis DS-3]
MARTAVTAPVVEMRGITVELSGVRVLDAADLTLRPGEVHALMGENGAGKSTLIGALTGTVPIQAGTVLVDGVPRPPTSVARSRAEGIATVFQESHLSPHLSVAENIMIGHEVRGRFGIRWARNRERAAAALATLGIEDVDPRAPLASLPPATKQLVAVARAIVLQPRVLVLDEPTSSLDEAEADRLLGVVRRLRGQGVAVLFVSHFLEQVLEVSDRMTVLRGGRVVAEYRTSEVDRAELISKMIGEDIDALQALHSERLEHHYAESRPVRLRAAAIGRRGSLEPTDVELSPGEVVGFAGLRGSGRTELARLMGGVERPDRGELWLDGARVQLRGPAAALRHRIAVSSEDLRREGIVAELTVRQNIVLGLQALRGWTRPLSRAEQDAVVDTYLDALHLEPADLDRPAGELSGGTQQKVMLARLLATRPHVLILDEPTRGIDIAAKLEIQRRVAMLAGEGVAVVFISSQLEEVVRLSDRIVVLKDREKIGELSNGPGVTVDTIVEMIAAELDDAD